MRTRFSRLVRHDSGQDLIEYAFLAVLVALVVVVALGSLGTNLNSTYDRVTTNVDSGASSSGATSGGGESSGSSGSSGGSGSSGRGGGSGRGRGN